MTTINATVLSEKVVSFTDENCNELNIYREFFLFIYLFLYYYFFFWGGGGGPWGWQWAIIQIFDSCSVFRR